MTTPLAEVNFSTEYATVTLLPFCDDANRSTSNTTDVHASIGVGEVLTVLCYIIICILGLLGNGLVIYVISRHSKMKTVTNMYILNLAISDVSFLVSMPFLIVTTLLKYWLFGLAMCKVYFVLVAINIFTSVFTLTAMSADRYMAVCHPIRSVRYRTPRNAFFVCLCIWSLSFFVMLPIILYSTIMPNYRFHDKDTCTISWPSDQAIPADKAFTWYTFLLGFAIPVPLLAVFYVSVILRLRTVGPKNKSKEKKRTHRKVTRMVLTVIGVYVFCWLPYWAFQMNLTFQPKDIRLPDWKVSLFNVFTVLTYSNSMLNPLLYAFLSDNFRKSFMKAFRCSTMSEVNKSLCVENSVFPRRTSTHRANGRDIQENFEFATLENTTQGLLNNGNTVVSNVCTESSTLYVDKESQT